MPTSTRCAAPASYTPAHEGNLCGRPSYRPTTSRAVTVNQANEPKLLSRPVRGVLGVGNVDAAVV